MRLIRSFDIIGLFILAALLLSCSRFEMDNPDKISRDPAVMRFSASYPLVQTRATEAGFVDGDQMGIFVVDYSDGHPGVLYQEGNRADNVRFTYDESSMSWDGTADIYWNDKNTPVDIYGYYPYDSELSSIEDYRFSVSTRQDTPPVDSKLGGYEASDLLWAKSENLHPTADKIILTYGHILAGITVTLQMGEGFDSAEWASLDKTVLIKNTITEASVNLSTGSLVPVQGSEEKTIVPYLYNDEYKAVVVPQIIDAGNELASITVDGISYSFSRKDAMTYTSGKMHKFTIRVDKRVSTGAYEFIIQEENISSWLDNYEFYDGLVRNYLYVHIDVPGTLEEELLSMGKDMNAIVNLKVSGNVNWEDIGIIGQKMPNLMALNLYDAKIDCDDDSLDDIFPTRYEGKYIFCNRRNLRKIQLPSNLKEIQNLAFYNTGLSGSLILPESLEVIGECAFEGCASLQGTLVLPSSLREVKNSAFWACGFTGNLVMPDNLRTIGQRAFGFNRFSGRLVLPSNIISIGNNAFENNCFSGDIIIPRSLKVISKELFFLNEFDGHIEFNDGVESIGAGAFEYNNIIGELEIPNSTKYIGNNAFDNSKISKISLPNDLLYLGANAFSYTRISGSVIIPEKIISLNRGLFEGCSLLAEVILSENVVNICERVFAYCYNLEKVVCYATEPPLLSTDAFEGLIHDNIIIEVPVGSVEKYRRAPGWKEFKRIAEYSNFVCRPAKACALNFARRQTLVLNADGPWTVSHLPEWCVVSPQSGDGKAEVTLTIDELSHGAGHRADSVVFTLADGGHETWCKVTQYDYEHDEDEVVTLQKATKGKGIDVIFLGDGWDGEAISNGSYMSLVHEQMEHFFGIEPYTTYRDYFNVYAGVALSQETGVNTLNTYRDTRFMTLYGGGGCKNIEPHLAVEKDEVFDYVVRHSPLQREDLPESIVILVPNSTDYGGCTYVYDDGSAISICCPSEAQYPSDTRGIIQHEAGGHGFGKLGDEMILHNLFADSGTKEMIDVYHRRGWYQNVATSDKMSDVPWAHFIFDPEYSDYVDMFEGAMGFTRGVWRSEQNSCMNYGIPYYNAISRQEIMRRILDYSGEGFTMEKFYATDSKKWGDSSAQTKAITDQAYVQNAWHTAPYVE